MKNKWRRMTKWAGFAALVILASLFAMAGEFPGRQPGPAQIKVKGTEITLSNKALSATWKFQDRESRMTESRNQLPGAQMVTSGGGELFRLGVDLRKPAELGCNVKINVGVDKVIVLASPGINEPLPRLTIPRCKIPGKPVLMRVGKLNLKAEPKDHADPGQPGQCAISEVSFTSVIRNSPTDKETTTTYPILDEFPWLDQRTIEKSNRTGTDVAIGNHRISITAGANTAAVVEWPVDAKTEEVACQIFKGTDQGMSWGPALALVTDGGGFVLVGLRDENTLNITTTDGEQIIPLVDKQNTYPLFNLSSLKDFRLVSPPQAKEFVADPKGPRLADRCAGKAIEAEFANDVTGLNILWRAELRDGSNYIRTGITIRSLKGPQSLTAVELMDATFSGDPQVISNYPGSPVADDRCFASIERPGSETQMHDGTMVRQGFKCQLMASPQQEYTFNAVFGVYPPDQFRRSFLYYLERERAIQGTEVLNVQ